MEEGTEKVVKLLRAIWRRKKREREEREHKHGLNAFRTHFLDHLPP